MYLRYGDPSWDSPETPESAVPLSDGAERRRTLARANGRATGERSAVHLPSVELHGVTLHAITERQCINHILAELDAGHGGVVVTPNLDHLRRCQSDVQFAAMVNEADLVVADGMPLVWASRLQGTPLPERVAGSNLISTLSGAAAARGRSIFLLGGAEGTAEGAAKVLQERFPGLRVAGTCCPQPGFRNNKRSMDEIRAMLSASGADIVYVALGSPRQEQLIADVRNVLPGAWWLGVGNSFSFLCGHVRRAPLWMQRTGIEWAHRLFQEPRRLFKRYIIVGLPFGLSLLGGAAMRAIPNRLFHKAAARSEPSGASIDQMPPPASVSSGGAATGGNGDGAAHLNGGANGHAFANGDRLADGTARRTIGGALTISPEDSALGIATSVTSGRLSHDAVAEVASIERLSRLRALVLLGGSVRPSPLSTATGRSILDLPLDESGTLLNAWLAQAVEVARVAGIERLPVRVLVNQASLEPQSANERYYGTFRVERDLSEYRGTGGVLRDVAAEYGDDDLILVANAAQVLLDPLAAIASALGRKGGDVGLVSHEDGTPSGVMLLSCKALRLIPSSGFVDMKEQVLPLIGSQFDVRVMHRRRPTGLPVRTLEDYIQALRFHHRRRAGKPCSSDPLAEDFTPAFSLVESGATVVGSARVHDSVVLGRSTVEPGAVLVRCLVCPGAVVRFDRTAVDALITGITREKKTKSKGAARAGAFVR